MNAALPELGIVTGSFICLFILPFLPIAYRLIKPARWPEVWLVSLILGTGIQAVTGFLYSKVPGNHPYGEIILFGTLWLFLLLWVFRRATEYDFSYDLWDEDRGRGGLLLLLIILCIAFVVRSIHPLQVAYLGQSDSYTHLNYLHNIVDWGKLVNPVYPSGYHWILGLPVLLFSIDPYVIARYAGAFFGVGLILGIYVLLDTCFNRRAAVFGSFCGACFPLMTLLMKTGVGAFANQYGLMLIPVIVLLYWQSMGKAGDMRVTGGLLCLSLCALVATVPMMLFHIVIIIACERCLTLFRVRDKWFVTTARTTLIILPAMLLLFFHLSQVTPSQRFRTADALADYGTGQEAAQQVVVEKVESVVIAMGPVSDTKIPVIVASSPYFKLILDYISIKRKNGYGNIYINLSGAVLAMIFLWLVVYGFLNNSSSNLLIGLWGFITTVQASTGFLQFSSYQREGWSLLIATCCLSGIFAAEIYRLGAKWLLFRIAVICSMAMSLCWTILHPPGHSGLPMAAEGELIENLRFLGQQESKRQDYCDGKELPVCSLESAINWQQPVTIVSSVLTGWGNQGEVTKNVLQKNSNLDTKVVRGKMAADAFKPPTQYVTFVDYTLQKSKKFKHGNGILLSYLDTLDDTMWSVKEYRLSRRLTAYLVVPNQN